MEIWKSLDQKAVITSLKAKSKKQVLQAIATRASELIGVKEREILSPLLWRENLGSTGIGNGIAIPHCKIDSINHMFILFAKLEQKVDFDADDNELVDMVFLLLAPPGGGVDHLKSLAKIARLMRSPDIVSKLRNATSREVIYSLLTNASESNAA